MIDVYFWPTPNGRKVTIMLEECGIEYRIQPVSIPKSEQKQPAYLARNPNGRIPAIVDHDPVDGGAPVTVFESGAILQYLAEKSSKFWPAEIRERYDVAQWLMWQMGGLGPIAGQASHFRNAAPEKLPYAIDRFVKEASRLYGVLDGHLQKAGPYIAGDYSIADMAIYPWAVPLERQGQRLDDFPHVKRWMERVGARPAVKRGFEAAQELRSAG